MECSRWFALTDCDTDKIRVCVFYCCLIISDIFLNTSDVPQSETGLSCYFTSPGSNSETPVEYFRILRIVYVVRSSCGVSATSCGPDDSPRLTVGPIERRPSAVSLVCAGSKTAANTSSFLPITYETFTPELVRSTSSPNSPSSRGPFELADKVETMNETFSKVIAFLQNSGLKQVYLIFVLTSRHRWQL